MARYETVIGLEVHVHLRTASKLFCSCPASFGSGANTHVCEVCTGMPGALPVVNARAVEFAVRMGFAVDCTINNDSVFCRKNYFYPDMPKGYQISQFDKPICEHGHVDIRVDGTNKRIGVTRIHLEDDAGKNIHSSSENASYVDLNRSGVPLIEIVSEPDMRSAAEAVAYLKSLYALVTSLGICDGNMEEGSFRCDANVSIRPLGSETLGTRAELKNLNSFRYVQKAIEYEVARQQDVLEDGGTVVQETRLYDSVKNITLSMRSKEEAHDYRYFPDPDLVPLSLDPELLEAWRTSMPELPAVRQARFVETYQLPIADAENLVAERPLADFFEAAVKCYAEPRKIANLILGALQRERNQRNLSMDAVRMKPEALAELARITDEGLISAKIAGDIFGDLMDSDMMPKAYVESKGLAQVSDSGAIEDALRAVLAENPAEVEAYKGGKKKLVSFFVGQVMRKTQGKANPAIVNELLEKLLA